MLPACCLCPQNGFGMRFNASLFRSMASAMKANGLLAAGYDLISAGGSTYPHQGLPPHWNSTNDSNIVNVIVRNASGYYTIDPARFPGPGSSAACLDEPTLRACLANHSKNGRDWSGGDPARCGCVNGNEGMAELSRELRSQGFRWGSYSNEARLQGRRVRHARAQPQQVPRLHRRGRRPLLQHVEERLRDGG